MIKIERPRFLTLLCLLSLIGGLYTIKKAIKGLFFFNALDTSSSSYEFSASGEGSSDFLSFLQSGIDRSFEFQQITVENINTLSASSLVFSTLSIIGVFFMYKLKRKGFFWYTLANVLMIAVPITIYNGNSVGMMLIAGQFFISALFILLYATQLKYMHS